MRELSTWQLSSQNQEILLMEEDVKIAGKQVAEEILGDHVLDIIVEKIRKDIGAIAQEYHVVIEGYQLYLACGQYARMGAKFYLVQLRFRFEIGNRGRLYIEAKAVQSTRNGCLTL